MTIARVKPVAGQWRLQVGDTDRAYVELEEAVESARVYLREREGGPGETHARAGVRNRTNVSAPRGFPPAGPPKVKLPPLAPSPQTPSVHQPVVASLGAGGQPGQSTAAA